MAPEANQAPPIMREARFMNRLSVCVAAIDPSATQKIAAIPANQLMVWIATSCRRCDEQFVLSRRHRR